MSGNSVFLDTNIVLYLLSGDTTLKELLFNKHVHLSIITEMELLSYQGINNDEIKVVEAFLQDCIIIDINENIKKKTIELRKSYKLKLPDSIILSSAYYLDLPLITADRAFDKVEEVNTIIYRFT